MTPRGWLLLSMTIGGVLIADGAYWRHVGWRAATRDAGAKALHDSLDHNREQLRTAAQLLAAEHRATSAELARDSIARARYVVARGRIRIVNDSQVAVVRTIASGDSGTVVPDSVNPTVDVPKEMVALVTAAEAALRQDSVTLIAQAAELWTLYRRDSLHVEREQLLEHALAESKPQRCGRRCGFVVGVAATVAATHPAETVRILERAMTWIVRRL